MMTLMRLSLLICVFTCLPAPVFAQEALRVATLGDCRLESGAVLRDCRIGYRTFGTRNGQRSNVVLFPTWVTGTSGDLVDLIGPGKLIDTTRYFCHRRRCVREWRILVSLQ